MVTKPELTLNEQYKQAVRAAEAALSNRSSLRQDSAAYQAQLVAALGPLFRIRAQVYLMGLFSDNETVDDVNTKDLKFLGTEYYIGELVSKKVEFLRGEGENAAVDDGSDDGPREIDFDLKLRNLSRSKDFYVDFLTQLKNYGVLNPVQAKKLSNFKDKYDPQLDELRFRDPALRREEKIANFRLEKQISTSLAAFERQYPRFFAGEDGGGGDESAVDEEALRELYLGKLRLLSLKAFSALEMLSMETAVLKNRPRTRITELASDTHKPKNTNNNSHGSGVESNGNHLTEENDYGYTDKLEYKKLGALLSKQGKVLQPFTVVSKKDELRGKVFGYGQTLPTMSVEEYIEEEIKRGGIKTETYTGEEKAEDESEDSDDDDRKVYEKRQWDEFKDEHARGEGNMKNKG